MPYKEEDIGKALVKARLVTQQAFDDALRLSKTANQHVGRVLVQQGLVTDEQIAKAMELCYQAPYVDLKDHAADADALAVIPFDAAWDCQAIPTRVRDGQLTVVMADPEDVTTVDYLQNLTGYKIRIVFSDPEAIKAAIKKYYGKEKSDKSASAILSKNAPAPVGPYSQAVLFNNLLFASGQIGLNAKGEIPGKTAAEQARQALDNLKSVLEEAGSGFHKILKTTIFLADMADYKAVNEVYAERFKQGSYPARSAVAVRELPKGALVEFEAIAYV